jgi:hypothetical protein
LGRSRPWGRYSGFLFGFGFFSRQDLSARAQAGAKLAKGYAQSPRRVINRKVHIENFFALYACFVVKFFSPNLAAFASLREKFFRWLRQSKIENPKSVDG